jgi:hypothetical protein
MVGEEEMGRVGEGRVVVVGVGMVGVGMVGVGMVVVVRRSLAAEGALGLVVGVAG